MPSKLIYWDSMCFIYRLKRDHPDRPILENITALAEQGKILIATSVFTMAEVAVVSEEDSHEEQERKIQEFFDNDFIYPVHVDQSICKKAREFVRLFGLKGKDAIHTASANAIPGITVMHSYDKKVLSASGKLPGNALTIEKPSWIINPGSGQQHMSIFQEQDESDE